MGRGFSPLPGSKINSGTSQDDSKKTLVLPIVSTMVLMDSWIHGFMALRPQLDDHIEQGHRKLAWFVSLPRTIPSAKCKMQNATLESLNPHSVPSPPLTLLSWTCWCAEALEIVCVCVCICLRLRQPPHLVITGMLRHEDRATFVHLEERYLWLHVCIRPYMAIYIQGRFSPPTYHPLSSRNHISPALFT